jgi:hypothetical protein
MKIIKIILLSFVYLILVYISLPLGTILWQELIKFSCQFYVCSNIVYPDIVPYMVLWPITILNFIFFILPLWIIIWIFWFFIIKYFTKKLKHSVKEKKILKIIIILLLVIFLIPKILFLYYYAMWSDYELEFKVNTFHTRYINELKKWPFNIF